jgi:predicted metal-dependent peptidase
MWYKNPKKLEAEHLQLVKKRMEWALSFLIIRLKFVHEVLSITRKYQTERLPSMGVRVNNGLFDLAYNPLFVGLEDKKYKDILGLTDEELAFVLTHEVLHMMLHHCTTRDFDDRDIGGLAYDLAVNELIPHEPGSCERPVDESGKIAIVLADEMKKEKMFSDIENKQTAEWYYDYLMKKKKKHGLTFEVEKNKNGDGFTVTVKDGKGKTVGKFQVDSHKGWKEDEAAGERIRAKVMEIDRRGLWNKAWGSESAGMIEIIKAAQKRRINWKNLIRRFYGNIVWKGREVTRKRPNRRTGFIHPGTKKEHVDRHLVAVDTSGSIDSKLLAEFLSVINGMLDYCPIDLMEFDWDRQEGPFPWDRKRSEFSFKGRGGTNFQPVIDKCDELRYRSLIILTDGAANECTHPKTAKVLWVLPEGLEPPVPWGQRVHMTRH